MILSVHQPQYIPWLGYFDKIDNSDCFVYLDIVQYKSREFQNRNKVRTKDGWLWLTVPVVSKGADRQRVDEVLIDNSSDWMSVHWKTLQSCYNRAPCFNLYRDFFEDVYVSKPWERLIDLNVHITAYVCEQLGIDTPVEYESKIGTSSQSTERIIELCQKLKSDTYLTGIGGRAYLDEAKFQEAGIKLIYQEFEHPIYQQLYCKTSDDFLSCLSILDLLFNEGPKSIDLIRGKSHHV